MFLRYSGAMLSSVIMIGKVGAETWLFGGPENELKARSFTEKLVLVVRFLPVFAITTVFRHGSGAVLISYHPYLLWPQHPVVSILLTICYAILAIAVFILLLLSMRRWSPKLRTLTVMEMGQGIIGESTTITVWGSLGQHSSRNIQLSFAGYHLVHNVLFLVCVINDITTVNHSTFSMWEAMGINSLIITMSSLLICLGILSIILFIYQIYHFQI